MKLFKRKKGQAIFAGIMVFILVFIAVINLTPLIIDQITAARGADNLNCEAGTLTNGQKATCILIDWVLPYFVGIVIAGAAAYITGRQAVNIVG